MCEFEHDMSNVYRLFATLPLSSTVSTYVRMSKLHIYAKTTLGLKQMFGYSEDNQIFEYSRLFKHLFQGKIRAINVHSK